MPKRTKSNDPSSYDIGYRKPPKATRFQPGQSGNPKGRPKGASNLSSLIAREMNTVVTITENGRTRQLKKSQIIAKQLANKSVSGDLKATALIMAECRAVEQLTAPPVATEAPALTAVDQLVFESFVKRLRDSHPAPPAQVSGADTTIAPAPTPDKGDAA